MILCRNLPKKIKKDDTITQKITLYEGDALNALKLIPDESIDAIISDPPYQLSSTTRPRQDESKDSEYGEVPFSRIQARAGFIGKEWDILPSVDILKEALRVLKSGAFALWLMTPRQDSQLEFLLRLKQAGFFIGFTPLYWTYSSGFPKALNIAKAISKRQCAIKKDVVKQGVHSNNTNSQGVYAQEYKDYELTPQAKALDGSYAGFQPKPAVEVVIVSMKPLSEKTYLNQALKNGKGITWLDDCRIPYINDNDKESARFEHQTGSINTYTKGFGGYNGINVLAYEKGRFPANLLVSDNVLDNGIKSKSERVIGIGGFGVGVNTFGAGVNTFGAGVVDYERGYSDMGQFSRYFSLDEWWHVNIDRLPKEQQITMPFLEVPKASKSERNMNLSKSLQNKHPTVKPLALMSYLITLTTRQGDTVLDPFVGSGTTMIASKMLNRNAIGIEREPEYVEIAKQRLMWGSGFGNIEWEFKEVI